MNIINMWNPNCSNVIMQFSQSMQAANKQIQLGLPVSIVSPEDYSVLGEITICYLCGIVPCKLIKYQISPNWS